MPYAEGRTFLDADSHIMELPDFLSSHADPKVRDRIKPLGFGAGGNLGRRLEQYARLGAHTPEAVVELERNVIAGAKGYEALGSFNQHERTRALDLLGFQAQLVFTSFSPSAFLWLSDLDDRYGGCRAHNRAVAEFCGADPRLLGVGIVSLADTERALAELDLAIDLGLRGDVAAGASRAGAARRATTTSTPSGPGSPRPGCPSSSTWAASPSRSAPST